MKSVPFEYGHGTLTAQLPDSAQVFVPGETVADPPFLSNPESATREAITHPLGMKTIKDLVGPGSTVTISFPDRVKGGFQERSHRRTSIPILIEQCTAAGVRKRDITLICAIGLHRKNTEEEMRRILGPETYDEFASHGQVKNHDAEDPDNLVDLGTDEDGNRVIMNREVFESDLPILIGHVLGNPYGGYSGGYKMAATGITAWRSIAAHHVPGVMHSHDFTPVSSHSTMRLKFDSIGKWMEQKMGHPFFMCDAVLDSQSRQIAVFAGHGETIQPKSWEVADQRTNVHWADRKFDVMVFGMPQSFHYGDGHGTNPILMLQAIAANVIRHRRVLRDDSVVICSSICNGYFHDEEFPAYRPLYELFQTDRHQQLPELARYAELFCKNEDYIKAYRYGYGYHPFHAFSMISCGHVAHLQCSAVTIVGAYSPGHARGMGMKTLGTFEEALRDAERYVGSNPRILALPRTFNVPGVHLHMKENEK